MVTMNIKISTSFSRGLVNTVRFLEDFILFISDLFALHLDPPSQAHLIYVTCKFLLKLLVEYLYTLLTDQVLQKHRLLQAPQ